MVLEWMLYGATRYHGKTAAQPLPDGSDDSELSPEEDEPVIRTHRPQLYRRSCQTTIYNKIHTDTHIHTHTYSKPRLSRTRLSRIFAQLGQNFENG